jgi:hypothetical protein
MVWISSSISASISCGPGVADDDDAAIVADEVLEVGVLHDRRERLEDRRLLGTVDMRLDLAARLGPQLAHQAVQHAERLQIVLLLGNRVLERFEHALAGVLHRRHRVGDQERAERSAADDDELPGLDEHVQMPAHRHESAEHAAQCNHDADQNAHARTFPRWLTANR